MSRKLPEELVPVLARTGRLWPQADEEGLRKAAGVWREFGKEADRLTRRCGESVRRVTADNSGHAVEAFGAYWQAFSGGGKGHLDDAHSAVGLVAGAFDTSARAVDTCKAEIIATLRQLAAELRQAEEQAAKAKEAAGKIAAAAAGGDPAGSGVAGSEVAGNGVVGGLRKAVGGLAATVENAATEQVAAGVAAVAVETAALKIGGLLAELGRAMKDALSGVLEEPAAVALLKLGSASGTEVTAASYRNGAFDPLAAGLPAALGEPGVLGADGSGLVLLAGKDGKPLVGVPGLTVKVDEQGKPVLGPDGQPVILRADGTPVADATGLLVVPGPDGTPVVGVADLAVRLDERGQPVLTDEDGKALRGVPLAGLTPGATGPGVVGPSAVGPGGDKPLAGAAPDGSTVPTVPGAVSVASVAVADPGAVVGVPDVASAASAPVGASAGGAVAAGGSPGQHRATGGGGGGDWAPLAPAIAAPARQSGGSAGWSDGDYPLQAPAAASHSGGSTGGPVAVRTDSVSAPAAPATAPVTAPSAGGPAYGPAPETPSAVRPVGVPGQFGTPAYGGGYGGYQAAGPVATVGPGPLAGTGGGPANVAAPFGSGVGAGAAGSPGGPGGVVGGGPAVGGPAAGGPPTGAPVARTPVGAAPQHPVVGPPPVHTAPPSPAAPPVVGTTPVIGRPEAHPVEARRRENAAVPADPTLAWGAVPVATAHAMALQLALRARRGAQPEDPAFRPRSIADSRPYGLPGGLAPVDPEHQAELERRAPRDADGLPVRHPDPAAGGWAEAVNDGGHREPGRANNSLEIALSAVECYTGRPTCAAPRIPTEGDAGERGGRDRAERELGAPFRDLGDGAPAFDRLADDLRRAGHGSQAVLLTLDAYGRPHAWNAVNHQDAVTYLDHQLARQAPTPLHPATHGLWAIALTPEGRPLPLTPAA
ncbi:toxin glutamine deamidase domain-containing protein [Kitasatospora sp. NPDC001261]|uniref:toxin glutamine deamidase domain-containing protein n=1 Tax=Kitasatospora sp. NPDC001261 TaxID=3364012 RepID=UPI00369E0F03